MHDADAVGVREADDRRRACPDSRIHSRPVSSPFPLRRWRRRRRAPTTGRRRAGRSTVTPVRTGPSPDDRAARRPRISVVWPTRTPGTSVIASCGSGPAAPDDDAEVSRPHPRMLAGRPRSARPAVSSGGDPDATDAMRHCASVALPRPAAPRHAPDRCRRARSATCPGLALLESARPGRNARWTLPHGRPGRGPRGAGGRARIRSPWRAGSWRRLDRTVDRPGRCPAVPRRARRVPRLRPRARARAAALDRRRRPGPAAAPPRAPRLGRRLGPADRARLARRPGARRRRPSPGPPARRGPRAAAPGRSRGRRPDGRRADRPSTLEFRSGLSRAAYEAGVEADPRAHRARRHLPGQPDPTARDAVRRRPVGRCTAACGPAIRRSSPRTSTWARAS